MLTFMLPQNVGRHGYGFSRVENDLTELQKVVGGYIQVIQLNENLVMIVDEEGKLKNKRKNDIATMILRKFFPETQDFVVGDALLVNTNEEDFTSIDSKSYNLIMQIIKENGLY